MRVDVVYRTASVGTFLLCGGDRVWSDDENSSPLSAIPPLAVLSDRIDYIIYTRAHNTVLCVKRRSSFQSREDYYRRRIILFAQSPPLSPSSRARSCFYATEFAPHHAAVVERGEHFHEQKILRLIVYTCPSSVRTIQTRASRLIHPTTH